MAVWAPLIWNVRYISEAPSGDQIKFANGAAATPGITFRGSASTGLYYTATQVNVSVGGIFRASVSGTGLNVTGDVVASVDVHGVKGVFTGDVSGVKGTFTGDVSGVKGTFSGDVSGVLGNFTGNIQQSGNTVVDTDRLVRLRNYVVASLPASPPDGATAFVTDSTQTMTAGIGTPVVGGGTNKVPVYGDGGVWTIG